MRVLFTKRTRNPFSWAVRKLTDKPYSHVAVEIDGLVYEAVLGGCRVRTKAVFMGHNELMLSIPVALPIQACGMRAWEKVGKAYDIPALFWFLLFLLCRRVGIKLPALKINPKWLICSEYAWYILTGELKTVVPAEVADHALALSADSMLDS
jgi:hypothetical protein